MKLAKGWPRSSLLAALLTLALAAASARAQPVEEPRFGAGLGLAVGVPQGDFRTHVDAAVGLDAYAFWHLAEPSPLAIRFEGLILDYGGARRPVYLAGAFEQPALEAELDHLIIAPLIGPQLGARQGSVRPYLNVGVGPSFFVTTEAVKVRDSAFREEEVIDGSTVFDDVALAWTVGGGLWTRVGGQIHITASVQYMSNSRVSYLADGLVRRTADGFIELSPVESRVNLVLIEVGVGGLIR